MNRCVQTAVLILSSSLFACSTTTAPSTGASPRPAPDARHLGIALFGRSVTEGFFAHWGVSPGRGYQRGHYRLLHRPFNPYDPDVLEWPRQIDAALQRYGRFLHAVHYKLCFVDFNEQTDLGRYQRLAAAIERVVVQKHRRKLIIGNALPAVQSASTPRVLALHREYNAFLARYAASRPRVSIFDQHRVLADAKGFLRAELAASPTDSHLNAAGYEALDAAYFAFLARVFSPSRPSR